MAQHYYVAIPFKPKHQYLYVLPVTLFAVLKRCYWNERPPVKLYMPLQPIYTEHTLRMVVLFYFLCDCTTIHYR